MYDLPQLIAAVIAAALGSLGLWTFGGKLVELIWRREEKEIDRLRADVLRMEGKHENCEKELAGLKDRFAALEAHHASLIPRWIKDARKRIVWLNSRALITIFAPLGYSRDQVEGRTFQELLDMEAAREIDRMDAAALANHGHPVSTLLTLHPALEPMHIVKVAGVGRLGELIYEGAAYQVNDPAAARDRGERRQDEQLGLSVLRLRGPDREEA
jgi:hypothetical protein